MSVMGADNLRVTHPCASDSEEPLDLHVLGMPPAFVLSQDQTLRCRVLFPVCFLPASRCLLTKYVSLDTIDEGIESVKILPSVCLFPVVKERREKKDLTRRFDPIPCSSSRGRGDKHKAVGDTHQM